MDKEEKEKEDTQEEGEKEEKQKEKEDEKPSLGFWVVDNKINCANKGSV
jgi:hypothetical protein